MTEINGIFENASNNVCNACNRLNCIGLVYFDASKTILIRYRAQTFRSVSCLLHENFIKICMNEIHLRTPRIICLCQAVLRRTFGNICMTPAQTFLFERQPVCRSDILSTVDNSFHPSFRSLPCSHSRFLSESIVELWK